MKKVKTSDYRFEEIGVGSAWAIFDIKCPYCNKEYHIKTLEYWNCETKQKCECGKKFLIVLD